MIETKEYCDICNKDLTKCTTRAIEYKKKKFNIISKFFYKGYCDNEDKWSDFTICYECMWAIQKKLKLEETNE